MGRRPEIFAKGNQLSSTDFRSLGKALESEGVGSRIDSHLSKNYPFLTRAAWQKRLEKGHIRVNGVPMHAAYKLREGDVITHFNPEEHEPAVDSNIFPFWEDRGVAAVYKPSNLPMHEGGKYRKKTFCELLKRNLGDGWAAVHRLDRDTSGLVLCAKDSDLREKLSRELRQRTIEKTYMAIAQGVAKKDYWVETGSLGMTGNTAWRDKRWVVENGLASETEFFVVERAENHTLLRVKPKTGRTHQIRIHAAYNDLPLVGDTRYNEDEQVFLDYIDHGYTDWVVERIEVARLCLHAAALSFVHPKTEKRCDVAIPMPNDMGHIWKRLKAQEGLPIVDLDPQLSLDYKNQFSFR